MKLFSHRLFLPIMLHIIAVMVAAYLSFQQYGDYRFSFWHFIAIIGFVSFLVQEFKNNKKG